MACRTAGEAPLGCCTVAQREQILYDQTQNKKKKKKKRPWLKHEEEESLKTNVGNRGNCRQASDDLLQNDVKPGHPIALPSSRLWVRFTADTIRV